MKVKIPSVFLRLTLAVFCLQLALSSQRTVFNNFVVEELGIRADQLGWIESVREVPGLLTIVLLMAVAWMAQSLAAGASTIFVAAGLLLYARAQDVNGLLLATVVYSIGFHLFFTLQSAMALSLVPPEERGKRLGQLSAAVAAATVVAALIVRITSALFSYRQILSGAGMYAVIAFLVLLTMPRKSATSLHRGLVFRKSYSIYYWLRLLAGARRQMFVTFAAFALVSLYGTPVAAMSMLFLVCNALSIFLRPYVGKLVDAWGEGRALAFNYAMVTLVFLGYAFVPSQLALYLLFAIDFTLSSFDVALNTFLAKLASPGDVAPTLAMGGTLEHVTAFIAPVAGGYLWARVAPQATFLLGAVLCLASLGMAVRLRQSGQDRATAGLPS